MAHPISEDMKEKNYGIEYLFVHDYEVRTDGGSINNEDVTLAEANETQSVTVLITTDVDNKAPDEIEEIGIPERIAPEPPPRHRPELISRLPATAITASLPVGVPVSAASEHMLLVVPTNTQGDSKGGGYRAMVARTMSRAKAAVPTSSPRTLRKRNVLFAKGRKVSVKDFGEVEQQGWLQYRVRGGSGTGPGGKVGPDGTQGGLAAHWVQAWFLLVGSSFYGFQDRESNKADRLIGLTGFTVALAPEVKSRKFAFKVYHAGKVFYFATEEEESLSEWMTWIADATIRTEASPQDNATAEEGTEAVYFSETDDETNGACCLTPRSTRKNIASGSSNPNLSSTGVSETKSQETQKKFSSLKKLGCKLASGEPIGQEATASSLDRKYLRFLKSSASRNVPVPTAKFRSYRRASRGACIAVALPSREEGRDLSPPPSAFGMVWTPDAAPSHRHAHSESSLSPPRIDIEESADLRRRRRYVPSPQVAAHAQTSAKPAVSARKGHNAPPDIVKRPCRHGSSDDPEERVRCLVGARLASQKRVSISSQSTSATTDGVPCTRTGSKLTRPGTFPQPLTPSYASVHSPAPQASPMFPPPEMPRRREFRGGSPEKFWIDSLRGRDEKVNKDKKLTQSLPVSSLKLKNAALYRPPPPPLQPKPHKREDPHRMKLAFEMNLDHSNSHLEDSEPSTPTGPRTRFRLFSPKFSRKGGEAERHTPSPVASSPTTPFNSPQKTLLGSPRLHRAIFGSPKVIPTSGENIDGVKFPSPQEVSPSHLIWPPSLAPPVPTCTFASSMEDALLKSQSKPTMGISMIGKQRRLPPPPPSACFSSSSSGSSLNDFQSTTAFLPAPVIPPVEPIPDYPGLEYPPVFEPGTYSLTEASFQRANRRHSDAPNRVSLSASPPNMQSSVVTNNDEN